MKEFDIAIIGSGSAGYVAAIRAAQLGKSVCVVEKGRIGGVCLNEGCIPTKAILASINSLETIRKAGQFGIKVQNPEIKFPAIIERKANIVKRLVSGVKFLLKQNKVEVFQGTGVIKEPGCIQIAEEHKLAWERSTSSLGRGAEEQGAEVRLAGEEIRAKSIIICTGSCPIMPFKSEVEAGASTYPTNVVTSKGALDFNNIPKSILIIGGGAIGVEFATMFCALGTKVTLIEMQTSILPEIRDKEIVKVIRGVLLSQGATIIEGNKVLEIRELEIRQACLGDKRQASLVVECHLSKGENIKVEKVLIACGRVPNFDGFEHLGLKLENKRIIVDERMCTSIEGIYAAGDVTGAPLLAHKASAEGIVAAENATGVQSKMDYTSIPSCIFSNPEIAWVGKFESEVPGAMIGKYNFQGIGKALCIGETRGFVKVVADKKGIVRGVHIIGPHASDLIQIGVMGVKKGLRARELGELIYPHPTLSECLKEAFLDVNHSAIHKIVDSS